MYPLQSEEIDKLLAALAEVHKIHGVLIEKAGEAGGGSRKWRYAKQDAILAIIHERCSPQNLILNRRPIVGEDGEQYLETELYHLPSKQWRRCLCLNTDSKGDKPNEAWGYSMTFHSRYDALAITGMAASDDPADTDGWEQESTPQKPMTQHTNSNSRPGCISERQAWRLRKNLSGDREMEEAILARIGVATIDDIPWQKFNDILEYVNKQKGIAE